MERENLIEWLQEKIDGVNHDLLMDMKVKKEGVIPHGDRNKSWLKSIKERRAGWKEIIGKVNSDLSLSMDEIEKWLLAEKDMIEVKKKESGRKIAFEDTYAYIYCDKYLRWI